MNKGLGAPLDKTSWTAWF